MLRADMGTWQHDGRTNVPMSQKQQYWVNVSLIGGFALAVVCAMAGLYLWSVNKASAIEIESMQVDKNTQELSNHETRITVLEHDSEFNSYVVSNQLYWIRYELSKIEHNQTKY
jgi:hypothetical protein